jgi:hypothetical protein
MRNGIDHRTRLAETFAAEHQKAGQGTGSFNGRVVIGNQMKSFQKKGCL